METADAKPGQRTPHYSDSGTTRDYQVVGMHLSSSELRIILQSVVQQKRGRIMGLSQFRSRPLLAGAIPIVAAMTIVLTLFAVGPAVTASGGDQGRGDGGNGGSGSAAGLGQLDGYLPSSHFTLGSAIDINLSNETARLPLYQGVAYKGRDCCTIR
jgi:hypothetical protein